MTQTLHQNASFRQRCRWIDIARGILILSVIIGHCYSPYGYLIYAFHIPAFFFFSGYTAHFATKGWLRKRFVSRLVSVYAVNVLLILLVWGLRKLCPSKYVLFYDQEVVLRQALRSLLVYGGSVDLGGATWFLAALFCCECAAKAIYELCARLRLEKLTCVVCIAAGMGGYLLTQQPIGVRPLNVDLGLFALFFYGLGNMCEQEKLLEKKLNPEVMAPLCAGILWWMWRYVQNKNNWPTREFGNVFLMVAGALSGIYLIFVVSRYLESTLLSRPMQMLGQFSFALMCYHFLAFRIVSELLYRAGVVDVGALKAFPTPPVVCYWPLYTLGAIGLILPVAKLAQRNALAALMVNGQRGRKA